MTTTGDIVDLGAVADAVGVSRRTVMRAAQKLGEIVKVCNKFYVRRSRLREILGDRYDPSVANIKPPVRGKHRIDTALTPQQAAARLKCARSTVMAVMDRAGVGIVVGGRRLIPEVELGRLKGEIVPPGLPVKFYDPKEMQNHARRMARARKKQTA